MTLPQKPTTLQSYQVVLYSRALHPELFSLKGRRVVRHGSYEFEIWAMAGAHLLRFEKTSLCACGLVIGEDGRLPQAGVVSAFPAAGEPAFAPRFRKGKGGYMTPAPTATP